MSAFYDNNVTDVGRQLLGDIQMGASFVPTKIVIGKGYMPQGKTTRTMTAVADVVKELSLNKAQKNPDGDAIFGAIFTNEDVQQAFYYRELGLYAKGVYYNEAGGVQSETAEVLYSYGNAGDNAELIPTYSTGRVIERQLDLLVYIGNDTQVNLTIETGLYVTIPVFNDTVAELREDIEEVRYIVDSGDLKKYQWKMTNGTLSLDAVDGSGKVNIADKETLDATKVVVDTINTNTSGLSTKIGETADTGGSSTAGSEFAKLNKIISDIAAHVAQWTAARAAKIDSIDTNSATASTKATEAANYGNEIKTQVAVNNTPSKTGTLSQKATQIIEDVEELNTGMGDVNVKLQDLAQEATVAEINDKIGTESDADTQPTLFGRLAQLKNVLLEKLAEMLTKVTGIDTKIGSNSDLTESATVFGILKNILKNVLDLLDAVKGKEYEFTEPGTYSIDVPSWCRKVIVTACAGGGAGGSHYNRSGGSSSKERNSGGGGGGEAVVDKGIVVTPGSKLSITVGRGGQTGGAAGEATILWDALTLSGGKGGQAGGYSHDGTPLGGEPGGEGGGKGGDVLSEVEVRKGENGIRGIAGELGKDYSGDYSSGGSGGGSLGNGGRSAGRIADAENPGKSETATAGERGGGGGGGARNNPAGNGGNGYVKITMGVGL